MSELNKPAMPNTVRIDDERFSNLRGMTLRQYAAIQLRVPMSGDDELDSMIREARRLDIATSALKGEIARSTYGIEDHPRDMAESAFEYSKALIAVSETDYEELERKHLGDSDKKTGIYALQPDAEGWIAWNGGECPVPAETIVQCKLRDPTPDSFHMDKRPASDWTWPASGMHYDIIAYRVIDKALQPLQRGII